MVVEVELSLRTTCVVVGVELSVANRDGRGSGEANVLSANVASGAVSVMVKPKGHPSGC